jgi:hypothetical protein
MVVLICPSCSKTVASLKGFCPHCGKKMSEEDPKLAQESTLQASADPAVIQKALEKKPSLKKDLHLEEGGKAKAPEREKEPEKALEEEESVEEIASLDDEESKVMAAELEAIAGYGPRPARWWEAVFYFVKVLLRKRALRTEVKKVGDVCIRKKGDRDSELLVLGHLKMKTAGVLEAYPDDVAAILDAKATLEAAGEEKISEEQDIEEKETYLNEEIGRYGKEVDRLTAEEDILKREQHQRTRELKQARAKSQKHELEIEEVKKIMLQQTKAAARPDLALMEKYNFQIREIEARKAAEEERIRQAQTRLSELGDKLGLVAAAIREMQDKHTVADQRKSQVLDSLQERQTRVAIKFHQQHNEYNKCLRNLADAAFRKGDIPTEFAERKSALVGKIKAADEADAMLEKYIMAAESFDHASYRRGMILLSVGSGVFAVILGLLAAAVIYLIITLPH